MITVTILPRGEDAPEAAAHLAARRSEAELKANSLRYPAIRSKVPSGVVVIAKNGKALESGGI